MNGVFITFEGVEGCGKSTQIALLQDYLTSRGQAVLATREPGGPPISEKIRALLLDPGHAAMSPVAELLLYEAARAQLVDEWIRPALEEGRVVLCDRFADSTTAYQGAGRALGLDLVTQVHAIATRGIWPDLTLVLDVPAAEGLARAARARGQDRIEREPLPFHEAVRGEFHALAKREPERVKIIDGTRCVDEVAADIRSLVNRILDKR